MWLYKERPDPAGSCVVPALLLNKESAVGDRTLTGNIYNYPGESKDDKMETETEASHRDLNSKDIILRGGDGDRKI